MIQVYSNMLSYSFMQNVFIVGICVSICASLLGVILVLKRYSMIGDGLSNVCFGLLTISTALGMSSPLYISLPGVIIFAIVLMKIGSNSKINTDSAIALFSSSALAVGIAVTSLGPGISTDICNILFGNILAITRVDYILSISVSIIVVILFILNYNNFFSITFDENFAKSKDLKAGRYITLVAILTGATIVIGMRIMGTMLISSIIIFPALISMRLFGSFKKVIFSSVFISVFSFIIGLYMAYVYQLNTGAAIILVNLTLFIISCIIKQLKTA